MLTLKSNMKRFAIWLAAAAVALSAGCPPDPNSTKVVRSSTTAPALKEVKASAKFDPMTHMLLVRIKSVEIELPVGTASGSEEIWSYLDEEPVGAARGAALGRNGLRVGMGHQDNWPDLAKVLKQMTGKAFRHGVKLTKPSIPAAFELNERNRGTTIFTSHANRSLSGADYPAGRDILSILCTIDEDEPSTVLVTASLQIESARRRPKLSAPGGSVMLKVKPTIYNFPELTFQLSVPTKGFLVIGPAAGARRPTSIGHHFLVRERSGAKFETVIVLTPEVVVAPKPKRPPAFTPVGPASPPRTR